MSAVIKDCRDGSNGGGDDGVRCYYPYTPPVSVSSSTHNGCTLLSSSQT